MLTFSRHFALWVGFLAVLTAAFTSVFACATPFIAFAAFAALTLASPRAQMLVAGVWLVNQAVGYGLLGYPLTMNSLTWGIILLTTSMLALHAAQAVVAILRQSSTAIRSLAAFAAAFTMQQALLYAVTLTPLGGAEGHTSAVVWQVLQTDAVAFLVLMAAYVMVSKFTRVVPIASDSAAQK